VDRRSGNPPVEGQRSGDNRPHAGFGAQPAPDHGQSYRCGRRKAFVPHVCGAQAKASLKHVAAAQENRSRVRPRFKLQLGTQADTDRLGSHDIQRPADWNLRT
jgi:hypothetical protein